jgi:uncharacterized integral membrane protein
VSITRAESVSTGGLITSPHYARTICCDRGYARPSLRAVGSTSRKPGVLGSSFDGLRTSSPCDVPRSTPQVRAVAVARHATQAPELRVARPSPRSRDGVSCIMRARPRKRREDFGSNLSRKRVSSRVDRTFGDISAACYRKGLTMTPRNIALLAVFVLFAVFVVQNVEVMDVRFLFWHGGASRALVLIGTFGFGLLAGWLTLWLRKREGRRPEELSTERPSEMSRGQGGTGGPPGEHAKRGGPPPKP